MLKRLSRTLEREAEIRNDGDHEKCDCLHTEDSKRGKKNKSIGFNATSAISNITKVLATDLQNGKCI